MVCMTNWITSAEATAISGFNSDYLRRLIRTWRIAAEKKGGHYWIDRQSLLDYLKDGQKSKDARRGAKSLKASS